MSDENAEKDEACHSHTTQSFEKLLKYGSDMIGQASRLPKKSELLIYYEGHGNEVRGACPCDFFRDARENGDWELFGSKAERPTSDFDLNERIAEHPEIKGKIKLPSDELDFIRYDNIVKVIEKMTDDYSLTIIMDSCFSGAWVKKAKDDTRIRGKAIGFFAACRKHESTRGSRIIPAVLGQPYKPSLPTSRWGCFKYEEEHFCVWRSPSHFTSRFNTILQSE